MIVCLVLVKGKIQRSLECVVHFVAERIFDRKADLSSQSEDQKRPILGRFVEIVHYQTV